MINHRYELIKLLPENPVTVELGVAEGLFSRDILRDWKPKMHYLVDLWETTNLPGDVGSPQEWHNANYNNVIKLIEPYKNYRILRGHTVMMAQHVEPDSVDLVYIDACHSYSCVKADINAWWSRLKVGGILAFHDYEMDEIYGVKKAVLEFCKSQGISVNLIPENKRSDSGAWIRKEK